MQLKNSGIKRMDWKVFALQCESKKPGRKAHSIGRNKVWEEK